VLSANYNGLSMTGRKFEWPSLRFKEDIVVPSEELSVLLQGALDVGERSKVAVL